jgi:hypothetical protein
MTSKLSHLSTVVLVAVCFAVSGMAQDDAFRAAAGDKYVISAKAGGVNVVEGDVTVARAAGRSGVLLKGDKLEVGDRVSTGENGRAEILLNPGSYLRLGGGSSFEFKTTSLDDLRLSLNRGSAIFEVFATDDFTVTVDAPKSSYILDRSGVYRVDVTDNGAASVEVWKGKIRVGESVIKGGKTATATGEEVAVAKFDRDEKDAFELWSKARSKQLAKVTSTLEGRDLRTALMRSFLGRRWNVYNSFGLWVYDPFRFTYCFLPFGYGWSSPYGYGFGGGLGWYNLPPVIYYPQPGTNPNPGSTPGENGGGRIASQGDRSPTPPFVRMQGSGGVFGRGGSSPASSNGGFETSVRPQAPSMPSSPPVTMPSAEPSSSGSTHSKKP